MGINISCSTLKTSETETLLALDFKVFHNILIVEGYLNDKWAKFIVDTGASTSILDLNQSKKYQFSYAIDSDSRLTGFGGRTRLLKTSTVDLIFKDLPGDQIRFSASDLRGINAILAHSNQKVLGIIGSDFLLRHGAIIDYNQNKIIFSNMF